MMDKIWEFQNWIEEKVQERVTLNTDKKVPDWIFWTGIIWTFYIGALFLVKWFILPLFGL